MVPLMLTLRTTIPTMASRKTTPRLITDAVACLRLTR